MNPSASWLPDILLWWQSGCRELSKYTKIFNMRWIALRMRLNTIVSVWGYSRILYSQRYYCLWESPPPPDRPMMPSGFVVVTLSSGISPLQQFSSSWHSKYWGEKVEICQTQTACSCHLLLGWPWPDLTNWEIVSWYAGYRRVTPPVFYIYYRCCKIFNVMVNVFITVQILEMT